MRKNLKRFRNALGMTSGLLNSWLFIPWVFLGFATRFLAGAFFGCEINTAMWFLCHLLFTTVIFFFLMPKDIRIAKY